MSRIFEESGLFIGTETEYLSFIDSVRIETMPRVFVKNALDIAAVQSRCDTVVSNATLAYWIAVGLGHGKIVHELAGSRIMLNTYLPEYARCMFVHDDNIMSFDFKEFKISERPLGEVFNKNKDEKKKDEKKEEVK